MKKDIYLIYLITFSRYAYFWLGIWVLYYLLFTNYAGIGFIETLQIGVLMLTEIPTGALSDLYGRKKILIIGLIITCIGEIIMTVAQQYFHVLISIVLVSIGSALYSGNVESILYEILKTNGQIEKYTKHIANINSIYLFSIAVCGIIGGFLFSINPRLPFLFTALTRIVGIVSALFLSNYQKNSAKVNVENYIKQNIDGTIHLFKQIKDKMTLWHLIVFTAFMTIFIEILDFSIGIQYKMNDKTLSVFFAFIFIIASIITRHTDRLEKYFKWKTLNIVLVAVFIISTLISIKFGVYIGALLILIREIVSPIFNSLSSKYINDHIESDYRTTTLSVFSMITKIPYALGAFIIGYLTDTLSALTVSFIVGVFMVAILLPIVFSIKNTDPA